MVTRWTLVRHAESLANAEGWLAGELEVPLTARGLAQAEALAARLADVRFDRVVSSDLSRARETARAIARRHAIAVEEHADLRERNVGAFARQQRDVLRQTPAWGDLLSWEGAPPGGESQRAVARRALAWFLRHSTGGDVLVVTHGGLLRVVVGLLEGAPLDRIAYRRVENVETFAHEVAPETWRALLARVG